MCATIRLNYPGNQPTYLELSSSERSSLNFGSFLNCSRNASLLRSLSNWPHVDSNSYTNETQLCESQVCWSCSTCRRQSVTHRGYAGVVGKHQSTHSVCRLDVGGLPGEGHLETKQSSAFPITITRLHKCPYQYSTHSDVHLNLNLVESKLHTPPVCTITIFQYLYAGRSPGNELC